MYCFVKRTIRTGLFVVTAAALITASAAASSSGAGLVRATSLNLRGSADISAEIRDVIPGGRAVVVAEKGDEWCKVVYNGAVGYAAAEYLSLYENFDADLGFGVVRGENVRLRESPDLGGEIICLYGNGAVVTVKGVYGPWYKVCVGGREGYIHSDFIGLRGETKPDAAPVSEGERIAETALKYLGFPYVWGGAGPSGFDCSGLVFFVYKECGYDIGRTSDAIYCEGEYVSVNDLRPGDAMCFANGGGTYVGHVGIYIGDGKFIHSSSASEGVIITDLSCGYYSGNFAGARRIV